LQCTLLLSVSSHYAAPRLCSFLHYRVVANMLLLDYQNVLIESLLKDRFSG